MAFLAGKQLVWPPQNNMMFTVLIPTLNEEKYLCNLLDSLRAQTLRDFEVIIVDAHSDDKTKEVADKYKKHLNLRVINSTKRNISYQRNLAAKNATTEDLVFFDADVVPEKNFLAKIHRALLDDNFDLASSWLEPISRRLLDKLAFSLYNRIYLESTKHFSPGGSGAFMYVGKKVFHSLHGFDPKIKLGEDFDLIKRATLKKFKYRLFRNPRIRFSVRRLDKEGRFRFFKKIIRSGINYHLRMPEKNNQIKYEFGKF